MQPLRYSINVTLDGCCDHTAGMPDAELHQHAKELFEAADALIFGRVLYHMMEAWRPVAEGGPRADWVQDWMVPFAKTIHAAKKYVVSDTLERADWNTEIIRGDQLEETIRTLKGRTGRGLFVGGVTLPLVLARLGLIDEYEFVVQPRIAGHGPTPFAGLADYVDLKLVGQHRFQGGSVALRYVRKDLAEGQG